jgi:hypothetical protein
VFSCNVLMSTYEISSPARMFDLIDYSSGRVLLVLYSLVNLVPMMIKVGLCC